MAREKSGNTENNEYKEWRKWCRLCAKCDPGKNISIFETNTKNIFDATLATAIGKYFWVNIKVDDHLSRDLCVQCHTLMTGLIAFADRVNKVQAMFCVLENIAQTTTIDSHEVRKQYGISDDWEHIIKLDNGKDSLYGTDLSNDGLEQSCEGPIIETIEYDLNNDEEKRESKRKIIKKEIDSITIDSSVVLSEYVESIPDNSTKVEQKIEAFIELPKEDDGDYDDIDFEVNDTEFEVEFMNDMEDNDVTEIELATNNKQLSEYKCELCGRGYRNPACYRKHILQAHNTNKYGSTYIMQKSENSEEINSPVSQDGGETCAEDLNEDKNVNDVDVEELQEMLDIKRTVGSLLKRTRCLPAEENLTKKPKVDTTEDVAGSSFRYNCNICNRPYKSPGCYRRHMFDAHQIEADIVGVPCNYCDETFPTEKQLTAHIRKHLPCSEKQDFECNRCDKKFTTSGALRQHINGIHFNEKPFICDECGKGMKTLAALNEHKLVHTDDKPVECEICGKGFKNKARMKVHMDTHASTGYKCNICNHSLNTRRTLRMHMLVHSDKKQYKCSFCPTEFKRSKALKNHLILHTGMRPFKCPYCEKTFSNGSNCRSHKKKVHPKELAEDEAKGIKRTDQEYVPNLNQLRAGAHIKSVKKIQRNRNGGLTPRMRALLIAAEKQGDQVSEYTLQREDSDTLESLDSFTVDGEEFATYQLNEQEVQVEEESDGSTTDTVQLRSVSQTDDNEESIIYEVLDGL